MAHVFVDTETEKEAGRMKKHRINIKRKYLMDFAAIAVVAILVIALGLRLCSESPSAEEWERLPEENGGQPQPEENEESQTTPAQFEVSELVIEPSVVDHAYPVNISVKVTNVGELRGTYRAVLMINGSFEGEKEVTLTGGETSEVSFVVYRSSGEICDISVDGLTGMFRVRDISWWDNGILREIVNEVFGEYYNEYVLEEVPSVAWLYKEEPVVSGGWGPYDREDDVVTLKGFIIYGTIPNLKEDRWLAKIDLSTYQVVEFSEITE